MTSTLRPAGTARATSTPRKTAARAKKVPQVDPELPTAAVAAVATRSSRASATRERIFRAARELFVTQGLGATAMEAVAARAGVNKRMVYHHFGSRDALFTEVLEAEYAAIRTAEKQLNLDAFEPIDGFCRLVGFVWDYFLKHPELLKLVNEENLLQARHIRGSERISVLSSSLIEMIRSLHSRGAASGACRTEMDPAHLWITIAGMAWFYIGNTHTLSVTFGRDMLSPRERRRFLAHLTDVVVAYVRPEQNAPNRR